MGLFQQPRQLMRNLSLSIRLNLGPYTMSNTCSLPGKSLIANSFNAATCPEVSSTDIPGLPMMSMTVKSPILLRCRIRLSSSFNSCSVGSLSPWVVAAPLRSGIERALPRPLLFHEPCYLLYHLELAPAPDRGNKELPRHVPAEPVYDDITLKAFNAFYHQASVLFKALSPYLSLLPEPFQCRALHYLELVELYALYRQGVEGVDRGGGVLLVFSWQA